MRHRAGMEGSRLWLLCCPLASQPFGGLCIFPSEGSEGVSLSHEARFPGLACFVTQDNREQPVRRPLGGDWWGTLLRLSFASLQGRAGGRPSTRSSSGASSGLADGASFSFLSLGLRPLQTLPRLVQGTPQPLSTEERRAVEGRNTTRLLGLSGVQACWAGTVGPHRRSWGKGLSP